MTKKDFELIARTINMCLVQKASPKGVAYAFSEALAKENPKFDTNRFLIACGFYRKED